MGLLDVRLPPDDLALWARLPHFERLRRQCQVWTEQGFGAGWGIYLFYALKAAFFMVGWLAFASTTDGVRGLADLGQWWATPTALVKAVLWAMLFEGLGFGCGSGPLTGRYLPPVVAFTHFLRIGTLRLPPWPNRNPLALGNRRSVVDVGVYLALVVLLVRALTAGVLTTDLLWPVLVAVVLLGVRDRTIFLALRSEHYGLTLLAFALVGVGMEAIAAAKAILLAIWWGAAISKANRHFPAVVATMIGNHPLLGRRVKCLAFVDPPNDARPSRLATRLAHGGPVLEVLLPLVLVLSDGGTVTTVALAAMLVFHLWIISSVAVGVPTEWNIFVIYAMFVLFGQHADVRLGAIDDPVLLVVLLVALVVVPAVGNLRPDLVSFLPAMRYYAGNWPASQWFFSAGALARLDESLVKTSRTPARQVAGLYDDETTRFLLGKPLAFRAMHLQGRVLTNLHPRAVDDLDAYEILDGEVVAGLALGWNFGDGHLSNTELLSAIQQRCQFGPGDVRAIMIEGQPMGRAWLQWRIVDAASGQLESGRAQVADFCDLQPWELLDDPASLGIRP